VRSKVLGYIRERKLMRAGDRVCVAVSGGADSVALLRVLLELRAELGIVLSVAHFNHRLRGADSEADEAFVAELARQHDLEIFSGRGDVRDHALTSKLNLEAAARELRYWWLTSLAESHKLNEIATAHTLDDQAETVLLKFLRGAGSRGLAGIFPSLEMEKNKGFLAGVSNANWRNPGRAAAAEFERGAQAPGGPVNQSEPRSGAQARIVRPLLCVTREVVEAYLTSLGQGWREDETNRDQRFARNRVRHELLPLLEREYNPNIRQVLSGAAELSRAEEEYWHALVERQLLHRIFPAVETEFHPRGEQISRGLRPTRDDKNKRGSDGTAEAEPFQKAINRVFERPIKPTPARLSLKSFAGLPLAFQRRLLRGFAETEDLALDFEHVEKLLRCASGELAKTELPGGWLASRRGDRLELLAPAPEPACVSYEYTLPIPGEVRIPEIGLTLQAMVVREEECPHESNETHGLLSAELGPELTVRNWRPGDRFWPVHHCSEVKLKRLFSEKHIPAEQRPSRPVVLKGELIVWVRGFPVGRAHAWGGIGDGVKITIL